MKAEWPQIQPTKPADLTSPARMMSTVAKVGSNALAPGNGVAAENSKADARMPSDAGYRQPLSSDAPSRNRCSVSTSRPPSANSHRRVWLTK